MLRNHPELRHLRDDGDLARQIVAENAPEGWSKEVFGREIDPVEFTDLWNSVKFDLDQDPLEEAISRAKSDPISIPGIYSPIVRLLSSVAAHRSLLSGGTFSLPQAQIAERTGIPQGTVCKGLKDLSRRGILRPEGEKGGTRGVLKPLKLYSYHGPLPKIENKPAPILPAPETAKEPEPVQIPREPEERLPKWSRAQVDAAWKGWDPDQRKLYREVYDRNKPGEAFEGEAASLAMDAVLGAVEPERKPEPETFVIPQAGGRKPWRVSSEYLEQLQAKYPSISVAGEVRKLLQKIEVTGEEIRYAPGYLEEWVKRAAENAPTIGYQGQSSKPGDPRDGEERDGKKWCAFNRCWVLAKNWEPKEEMAKKYAQFLREDYE